jgi:hypothetical protein
MRELRRNRLGSMGGDVNEQQVEQNGEKKRRRVRKVVAWTAAVLVVIAVGIYIIFGLVYDDSTTPVAVDDVVESFREAQAEAQGEAGDAEQDAADARAEAAAEAQAEAERAAGRLPAPGVYVSATTGEESVDALGGTTHHYPDTTTITVSSAGCGVRVRWDALVERYEDWQLCDDEGALTATRFTTFHEFFGQSDRRDLACAEPLVLVPAEPVVGDSWTGRCAEGTFDEVFTVSVRGLDTVDVGGEAVEAVHIHLDMVVESPDDDPSGGTITDFWIATEDRMILRWDEATDTIAGSFVGPVRLQETYGLTLTDLAPRA